MKITGDVTNTTSGSTYTVEYAISGVCPGATTQTFVIPDIDDASFTITPTCSGATATIDGTTGGTFSFNPLPGDGAIIDANTGTVTGATLGTVYFVEYATTGICANSSIETFSIIPADDPSFSLTPNCTGATASISGDTGGTFTFNPDPADGAIIDAASGTITNGVSDATYTVEYTTSGPCVQTSQETVTVFSAEDASFTYAPNCDGAIATITGDSGGTFTFNTEPGSDPFGEATIDAVTGEIANVISGATYVVDYTTSGDCPENQTVSVTILEQDDSSFTIAPTCSGGTSTITGLIGGTFTFNPLPTDGAVVDANTGLVTNAEFNTTYTIEYTTNGACPTTTAQTFTVFEQPTVIAPTPLEVCDDGIPDGTTLIDLSLKDAEITGGDPTYAVTYHLDQSGAESGASPLPVPYQNEADGQEVYARVEDTATGCYATTGLILLVEQAPVANAPSPIEFCDPDSDGYGVFDLGSRDAEVTGGDPSLEVSYHETAADAMSGSNPLSSPYVNINIDSQTVYVRVESGTIATDCASFTELQLTVSPTPQLGAAAVSPLRECDGPEADGIAEFDLTDRLAEILQELADPSLYTVRFYEDATEAELGDPSDAIASPFSYSVTDPFGQTLTVRVEDNATGCFKLTALELVVDPLPVAVVAPPLEQCDDDVADGLTVFDLTDRDAQITGGEGSSAVAYYETLAQAELGTGAVADPTAYTNTSVGGAPANPQTLWAVVTDTGTGCTATTTLTIRVLPRPTPTQDMPELVLCDETDTGDLVETFDLTADEPLLLNGEAGVTASYHETLFDARAGPGRVGRPFGLREHIEPPGHLRSGRQRRHGLLRDRGDRPSG